MQNIRKANDKIYRNLMWFPERVNPEDIQIEKENNASISVKEYLMEELNKMEDGSADYIDIDQLDESLEATIRKYET